MRVFKWLFAAFAVILVLPGLAKMFGIEPRRAPTVSAAYDLHSDPEYIETSRRQSVKLDDMRWKLSGFGTVMVASFVLKNERSVTIKDAIVRCDVSGSSGTKIASLSQTVFQKIDPGKSVKIRDLSMGFVRDAGQADTAICVVENHSDG